MAATLPADSRTMREVGGLRYTLTEFMLAGILDQLRIANWYKTKDARKKRNFPKSYLDAMLQEPEAKEQKDDIQTFRTGDDFERRLRELRGENNGN